jgi:hypothetical protein
MQKIIDKELDEMLELGVVQESKSNWSNPTLIVSKKDGSNRFCIDSRRLNEVTKSCNYPLPNMQQILSNLRNAKFISSIDLSKAFWQIKLEKSSREKTAFAVPGRGLFHFVRMPFGLKNAAGELQHLVDNIFGPKYFKDVFCYLDDLIIVSPDFNSHLRTLDEVHSKLKEAGLTIKLSKCEFCKEKLKYLGFIVDRDGLRPDPEKIKCIVEYPRPNNLKQLRSFLGMVGFYRKNIRDFSEIAVPLNKILRVKKGEKKFSWSPEAESGFVSLKRALVTAPVLVCPDFEKPFILHCDASKHQIGAALHQKHDGQEVAVAYFSRTLNKHERNYGVTERELLAVVCAIEYFRPYLEGVHFKIITDHSSLKWLWKLSNPSGRLARWSSRISQYNFSVEHRKGTLHAVPDALSRIPGQTIGSGVDVSQNFDGLNSRDLCEIKVDSTDSWYNRIRQGCLRTPQRFTNYQLVDDVLYRNSKLDNPLLEEFEWKKVVKYEDRLALIMKVHNIGHPGAFKTYKKLERDYYWPGMFRQVKVFVNGCHTCKSYKPSNQPPNGLMEHRKKVSRPMEMLSIDLVGPLPLAPGNFQFILSAVDVFTKYCWLCPLRRATTKEIVFFLGEKIFLEEGTPHTLVLDNGKQFVSNEFKEFADSYGISRLFYNTPYTPQNNTVESYNKVLGYTLAIYVDNNQREWPKYLDQVKSVMNNTINFATGFTPSLLMKGREIIFDGSLYGIPRDSRSLDSRHLELSRSTYRKKLEDLEVTFKIVQENLWEAYNKKAQYYNLRRVRKIYREGQVIWRRNFVQSDKANYFCKKLAPKFVRAEIIKRISDNVYDIKDVGTQKIVRMHVKDILKWED